MSWQTRVRIAPPSDGITPPSWSFIDEFVLDDVQIAYGRMTPDELVSPTSASISLLLDSSLGSFSVDDLDVGHQIEISVIIGGDSLRRNRFSGNVTDIGIDKDRMTVTAVSSAMSRYGKYSLTAPITTNNTAGIVAIAIANNALPAVPNSLIFSINNSWSVGVFQLDADFPAGTNALEALQTTVQSEPFGFMYEDFQSESIISTDQDTRKTKTPDFTFTGGEILDDWAVSKSVTSSVTAAVVNYVGGNSVKVSATTNQGEIERIYETIIVSAANATTYATYMVGRGEEFAYDLPTITIPVGILSETRQRELIAYSTTEGVRINSFVRIPQIRPYITTDYFVEGWSEQISRSSWNLTLHLSNVGRSRYFQAWNDVTPTLTWAATPTTETWLLMRYDWI